jgi:hypothetical protein
LLIEGRSAGEWEVLYIELRAGGVGLPCVAEPMRSGAQTTEKFCCPHCGAWKSKVIDSRPDTNGTKYLRWRHCNGCHQLFETAEAATGRLIPLHGDPAPKIRDEAAPFPQAVPR